MVKIGRLVAASMVLAIPAGAYAEVQPPAPNSCPAELADFDIQRDANEMARAVLAKRAGSLPQSQKAKT